MANYKMIALQVGNIIKYVTTEKELNLAAQSVFNFNMQEIRISDSITSTRAKLFSNWILSLALQSITLEEKNKRLLQFLDTLLKGNISDEIIIILEKAEILISCHEFTQRDFHQQIQYHCKKLFQQQNYFHAVFEAAKVYNKFVQQKSKVNKDGSDLMLNVLSQQGVLKLNLGETKTEQNIQDGIKFLSVGLMQAMRNPTAHEPALDWPIGKQDCLDMLSFISYLFRQLDNAFCITD